MVQRRGSDIKLKDILNYIYDGKVKIRDIINENNNIAKYEVTIYNYLANLYNKGYIQGYHDKYFELGSVHKYPEAPKTLRGYEYNNDENYDPTSVDGLTDIMDAVLGYKLNIKEVLYENEEYKSDYWPTYYQRLLYLADIMENNGKSDGEADAQEDFHPASEVHVPTFTFDSVTNSFTISSDQEEARCYFKITENGSAIVYDHPVQISGDMRIWYFAKIGGISSEINYEDCEWNEAGDQPEGNLYVEQPDINIDQATGICTIPMRMGDMYIVTIINGQITQELVYNGAINLTQYQEDPEDEVTVVATAWVIGETYEGNISMAGSMPTEATYTPTAQPLPKCEYVTYVQDNNIITLETLTEDATIYYSENYADLYNEDYEACTLYEEPFTLTGYLRIYAMAIKEGYENSTIKCYYLPYNKPIVIPNKPTIKYLYNDDPRIRISTTTNGAIINYKYGYEGALQTANYYFTDITPPYDCTIYAYASYWNGTSYANTEYVTFEYDWNKRKYSLPEPTLTLINNRVYVDVDFERQEGEQYIIRFTTDGGDPIGGQQYNLQYDRSNIVITEDNTVVKVILDAFKMDNIHRYSPVVTRVFSPVYDEFDYSQEYFNVKGATEINISSTRYNDEVIMWSYDKVNWTKFKTYATGLDPDSIIYLKGNDRPGAKDWTSMWFGDDDEVTVSGNIMSLVWPDTFLSHPEVDNTMMFKEMFKDCTQIVDAKNLIIPQTSTLGRDFYEMFSGCVNLTSAPKMLNFVNVAESACYRMFYGCISLVSGPNFTFETISSRGCEEMFCECENLMSCGKFNVSLLEERGLKNAFYNCSSIPMVQMNIIDDELKEQALYQTFYGCISLNSTQKISADNLLNIIQIRSTKTTANCCESMFDGCTSLTYFPALLPTGATICCYKNMFKGCTSLTEMGGIMLNGLKNEALLARNCMEGMFEGCTSLTQAPEIYLTDINSSFWNGCMNRMFYGCTSLNYIKCHVLTDLYLTSADKYPYTFEWVKDVAESGTFIQDDDANWYRLGISAIPEAWVINTSDNAAGRITDISCKYDVVSISASNANAIYYQINRDNGEWLLYTGPFEVDASCKVYARCLSNRGVWGQIRQADIDINVPNLIITYDISGHVTITYPADYNYDTIYYKERAINSLTEISGWLIYNGPFVVEESLHIMAFGLKANGTNGPQADKDIILLPCAPEISCIGNVVRINADGQYDRILYNFTGTNPWQEYIDPFIINEDTTVYAYTEKWNSGSGIYENSNIVSTICIYDESGQSGTLKYPVFRKQSVGGQYQNNIIICTYDGNEMRLPAGIHVMYQINGGEWEEYIFNGTNSSAIILTEDVVITTYAYSDDGMTGDSKSYSFTYDQTSQITKPDPPQIIINKVDGHTTTVRINPVSQGTSFVKIIGSRIPAGYNDWSISYGEWLQDAGTFTVYAYTRNNDVSSDIAELTFNADDPDYVNPPTIIYNTLSQTAEFSGIGTHMYRILTTDGSTVLQDWAAAGINPVTILQTCKIEAYSLLDERTSPTVSRICVVSSVSTPVISYENGIVTITCVSSGATIKYFTSTDGETWGAEQTYNGSFTISQNLYIKAYAVKGSIESNMTAPYYAAYSGDEPEYAGDDEVVTDDTPLTIEMLNSGTVQIGSSAGHTWAAAFYFPSLQYKINDGEWITWNNPDPGIDNSSSTTGAGYFIMNLHQRDKLRIKTVNWDYNWLQIRCNVKYNAYGHMSSLHDGSTRYASRYLGIFEGQTNLRIKSNKPLYHAMNGAKAYNGCTGIITPPVFSGVWDGGIYEYMFCGCTNMILDVSNLGWYVLDDIRYLNAFRSMFYGCTNVTGSITFHNLQHDSTPQHEPLATGCFVDTFRGCNLTNINFGNYRLYCGKTHVRDRSLAAQYFENCITDNPNCTVSFNYDKEETSYNSSYHLTGNTIEYAMRHTVYNV